LLNRFLIAGLIALAPAISVAHHSTPLYDMTKKVTVESPLTNVKFGFPHPTASASWQNKTWKMTFPPVGGMVSKGLTQEILSTAKSVTIVGNARKDGTPEIRVSSVTIDGKKFF
jgi:hypothetical protein